MPIRNDAPVRSLRDVMWDFEVRGKPVTKAMAEEAARAVAADGKVTKDEVDLLRAYGDGPINLLGGNPTDRETWKKGSETGRALFAGLSDTIESMYDKAVYDAAHSDKPKPPANPFTWWMTGWTSKPAVEDPKVASADALMKAVRERSIGWVDNSVSDLLAKYPKATKESTSLFTFSRTPKPAVKKAIDALKKDWLAGKIDDLADLASPLKPMLDKKYR